MHYDYFRFRDRHNISDEKLKDIHKWSTEEQIEKEKNALPERTFLNVKRRTKKAKGGAKK
jgi:hypothetical protein